MQALASTKIAGARGSWRRASMDLADTHMTSLAWREVSLCLAWTELCKLLRIERAQLVSLATELPTVAYYWLTTLASLRTTYILWDKSHYSTLRWRILSRPKEFLNPAEGLKNF